MANIILPQVEILDDLKESSTILVEQDGGINRFRISDLNIDNNIYVQNETPVDAETGSLWIDTDEKGNEVHLFDNIGFVDIDLSGDGSNIGSANPVNADTLGGITAENYAEKEYVNNEIINRVIYGKGKNLLKIHKTTISTEGVTYTVLEDGSIMVNGSVTTSNITGAYGFFPIVSNIERQTTLKISGCPVGGNNNSTYRMYLTYKDNSGTSKYVAFDTGSGASFTLPEDSTDLQLIIAVYTGYTANNLIFYPMIQLESETNNMYEPYYDGLRELTNKVELVWKNASPASEFAAQTLELGLNDYDMYIVIVRQSPTISNAVSGIQAVGSHMRLNNVTASTSSYTISGRLIDYVGESNGSLKFYSCTVNGSIDNSNLIPQRIYGIKGVRV